MLTQLRRPIAVQSVKYFASLFKDTQTCTNGHRLDDLRGCEISILYLIQLTDGCRTLISAIFDLQNQSFAVPQRAVFLNSGRTSTENVVRILDLCRVCFLVGGLAIKSISFAGAIAASFPQRREGKRVP
jgi:hypothetical protein